MYSGKHKEFGGNIQFLAAPDGTPLWVSQVEPGTVHDIVAARLHALPALYKAAAQGLPTLADSGYEGAGGGVLTPFKKRPGSSHDALHVDNRAFNQVLRGVCALGERAAAELKERWRALKHVTHKGGIKDARLVFGAGQARNREAARTGTGTRAAAPHG